MPFFPKPLDIPILLWYNRVANQGGIMENIEKFEKYLQNKEEFLKQMLLIIKEDCSHECYQIQLETVEDIIHHFNLIVKGEKSSGVGTE